ncbi:MAG: PAS domain S-box protein [Myxococcota bacterium]
MSDDAWTEAKFRALTLNSVDIISLLDGQGRLLFNSPATLRINGFTPEELAQRDTFELMHPDDRARVRQTFSEVLATPGAVRTVEYRYQTKDGRWIWMEAVASNQLGNPAVRGVVANSRDISERKHAEEEKARLERQLQHVQKLESLGVLAGGVAHDFNNLLAVILGEVNVLKDELGKTAPQSLAHIESAARNAKDLTRQLLLYAGQPVTTLEPCDLHGLVDELAPLLKLSARGEATLRLELEDRAAWVSCDRGQVGQVLLNLVLNASEALTGPGTVTVRLSQREVAAAELAAGPMTLGFAPGPAVVLEVADTGKGMTPETLARIFDPFFSTKQTGRGLGLAAVAGIVRANQAGLKVESAPGRGATFTLYFRPEGPLAVASGDSEPRRFSGRVLVVDDDTRVAMTTSRLLRTLGFECLTALSGMEAVAAFSQEPHAWTLVVCDVLMPGLGGPDAVAQMRALRHDVPVLFVSGYLPDPGQLPEDAHSRFLAKPYEPDALSALILELAPEARQRA